MGVVVAGVAADWEAVAAAKEAEDVAMDLED